MDEPSLKAGNGEFTATIQITRKETGKVEEYVLHSIKENQNGSDALDSFQKFGS